MPTPYEALCVAIDQFDSQTAFAAALSRQSRKRITSQAVSAWKAALLAGKADAIPEDRCEPIESLVHGVCRVEELRPDVQWQRNGAGQVIALHPAPRAITPTNRPRKRARA